MRLEEAKEILNWSQQQMRLGNLPDYSQNVYQAEVAVLQELEHLQKENEELKDIDLTLVHIKGVADEKDRWRNKIRKMIETLEEQEKAELEPKDVLVFPKDTAYLSAKVEYYHKKNILQDLLKEE